MGKLAPIVFISSTSEDLKAYRQEAKDASISAEFIPRMMEYFVASGERPPLAACLSKVSEADVLVVIVAHRYGWVPPDQVDDQHKSITWLECEHAKHEGKKEVIAFVLDEAYEWPEHDRERHAIAVAAERGDATDEDLKTAKRSMARLRDFKAWLNSGGIRNTFTSPEDLRGKVADALRDWRGRHADFAGGGDGERRRSLADPGKYRRDLLRRTEYIDIRGLQVGSGKAHRFPIEELYIPLTTTMTGRGEGADASGAGTGRGRQRAGAPKRTKPARSGGLEEARSAPVPLQTALVEQHLVVVGDPGAGKTTFLRRIGCALCQTLLGVDSESAKTRLGLPDRPLPILVRLADLGDHIAASRGDASRSKPTTEDAAGWLPHFLAAASQNENWGLDKRFFRDQLDQRPTMLLLDGLDEASNRVARESISRLIEGVGRAYPQCRIVVASRPGAYVGEAVLPGFRQVQIAPLESGAVQTFLKRWCNALWPGNPTEADRHHEELVAALRIPEIARMARNPVMLTALAVVHWNERRLPEQRADLYESVIRWLSRSREKRPQRPTAERCVALLQELALAMQQHAKGRQVQVPSRWAAEAIAGEVAGRTRKERTDRAEQFLGEEELDSGIVAGRGHELRFWHLTFQEFLAAKAIAGQSEQEQRKILLGKSGRGKPKPLYTPEWREVALLLGGVLHQQGQQKVDGLVTAVLKDLGQRPAMADQARCVGLLGAMVRDLEPLQYEIADRRYQTLLESIRLIFDSERSASIPIEVRIEAADALGQAGDPRLDPRNPDRWVTIPMGSFRMGAQKVDRAKPNFDEGAFDDELPVHEVTLDEYRMARYPATVEEYGRFVNDDGYSDERCWTAGGFGQWTTPADWEDQLRYPNRPVVGVSWFEAAAYCQWARYRLPTEAEWERAARGTDGRRFPWGNEPPDQERLNYDGNVGHPTPVGVYPRGATRDPAGIQDMAGNVWEWCQDWYGESYYSESLAVNPSGPEQGSVVCCVAAPGTT